MSKIEVDAITQQSGSTLTVGGGASKTVVADATTVTLGRCGGTVALASGATQSGFGRTGTVDWDTTPKTATFSAVSGDGFFCNTTAGAFTCNLPAGTAGSIVSLADYAGTWQTNNLTVSPNGSQKIGGINSAVTLQTEGQSVTFIYADDTQGWLNVQDSTSNVRASPFVIATGGTITECGNDKIHTFTGPGTFQVTNAASCAANNIVSYLVIAGGGGAGHGEGTGAGGAGGYRELKSPVTPFTASPLDGYPNSPNRVSISVQSYPITVGAGGVSQSGVPPSLGTNGGVSTFSTITSAGGGGGGGGGGEPVPQATGSAGGSGGGGGGRSNVPGGAGNTPPVTPAQGNNGGSSALAPTPNSVDSGGGGGGATAAGNSGANCGPGGNGGAGATSSINGTPTTRGGGGAGGSQTGGGGTAGPGGGGQANTSPPVRNGTDNTGGGGGGSSAGQAGNGGSGLVIIRYKFQ